MTISSQPTVTIYSCDGVSRTFTFPYRFLDEADLRVDHIAVNGAVTELTLTTHYTVTGAGEDAGGKVVTNDAYADGKIRIWLRMPITQLNTYENNTPFPARSHEDALDRLTLLDAMRKEEFERSIHARPGEVGTELPPANERAGRLWASDSEGGLVFVPGIDNASQIEGLLYARAYYDTNLNGYPRLIFDVEGHGSTPITGEDGSPDIANPGGMAEARIVMQARDQGGDRSLSGFLWLQGVFDNWTEANKPRDKRSKYTASIGAMSKIDGVYWANDPRSNGDGGPVVLGQEVGPLSLQAVIDNGVANGKAEGLVVFAKQNPQLDKFGVDQGPAGQGKCVGVQAGTVMNNPGPIPDDKTQIDTDDEDAATIEEEVAGGSADAAQPAGEPQGGFTLRANGAGTYRSWAGLLIGGRAGHFNGVVMNTPKSVVGGDNDGIFGIKGVWGGRSFWQKDTFAVYAKDGCPGWVCIGHDGIPDTGDSGAAAPLDIKDGGTHVLAFNGQHVLGAASLAFNGVKVVGPQDTGWTPMGGAAAASKGVLNAHTGSSASASYDQAKLQAVMDDVAGILARLKAYDQALFAHGLIGPTP